MTEVLTPPQLAVRWGVHPDKVLHLINTGELKAINLAMAANGRPRWKITQDAIERFENARSNRPQEKKPRRRRRQAASSEKDYF